MVKRDWGPAREKVEREGACRIGGRLHGHPVDAAHIVSRARIPGPEAMDPLNIIALCRPCHENYDAGRLDILPFLRREEQAYAVSLVGIAEAYQRLIGRAP